MAVTQRPSPDVGVDWSDFDGPLIIILVAVPSGLAIIATIIFLYIHINTRSWEITGVSDKHLSIVQFN